MIESVHGLPLVLCEGLEVAVVPPPLRDDRWHVVEHVTSLHEQTARATLAGVRDLGAAERLCGTTLLAAVDDLPDDYLAYDVDALLGRSVSDERFGDLGAIAEVMRGPANDVWVVRGRLGEVLVPVAGGVVRELGPDGPIRVDLPDGLVERDGGRDAL